MALLGWDAYLTRFTEVKISSLQLSEDGKCTQVISMQPIPAKIERAGKQVSGHSAG